jgi:hypothetical protein
MALFSARTARGTEDIDARAGQDSRFAAALRRFVAVSYSVW